MPFLVFGVTAIEDDCIRKNPFNFALDTVIEDDRERKAALRRFDIVADVGIPQKLMVYIDLAVFEVQCRGETAELGNSRKNVKHGTKKGRDYLMGLLQDDPFGMKSIDAVKQSRGETAELGNSKSCAEQDDYLVTVFPIYRILLAVGRKGMGDTDERERLRFPDHQQFQTLPQGGVLHRHRGRLILLPIVSMPSSKSLLISFILSLRAGSSRLPAGVLSVATSFHE